MRTSSGEARKEATPHPNRRPLPPFLPSGGSSRRRAALPPVAAPVLHRRCGFRNCAVSRWPTWTLRTARFSSTRARAARIVTSCLAGVSPRPFGPTSPLTPTTAGCSRPVATRSFHPASPTDRQTVCRESRGKGHAAHFSASGDHLAHPPFWTWPTPSSANHRPCTSGDSGRLSACCPRWGTGRAVSGSHEEGGLVMDHVVLLFQILSTQEDDHVHEPSPMGPTKPNKEQRRMPTRFKTG